MKKPKFTEEEQAQIVTDLLVLTREQIRDFLARNELPVSGTKEQYRGYVEKALQEGVISLSKLVEFLDEVIPWGKQHVFLYKGPKSSIANWKKTDWMVKLLKKHRFGKYLNASLPLALPKTMKVSSILHDPSRLRVTAIKRRDWWDRNEEYDGATTTAEGDDVQLRAFVHRVTRSLVAFEWNLVANTAFLQISQLPTGFDYGEVAEEFFDLIAGWLDIREFPVVDLRNPIKKLHELEEAKTGETRSHGINYRTLQGKHFDARSASASDPLFGEADLDAALSSIRKKGVGHLGNFYWLPNGVVKSIPNLLETEIHVIIVGSKNRINFPIPNGEQPIRHVLSRIRSHCS
jgi:hypothetical protein